MSTALPLAIRADVKIVSFVRAFRLTYDRGPSLREIMIEVVRDQRRQSVALLVG